MLTGYYIQERMRYLITEEYNTAWFLRRVMERRPTDYKDYIFLEDYVNAKTYIKAYHKPCGNRIMILPNTFISRGSGCKYCSSIRGKDLQRKTTEQYTAEIAGRGVELIGEYTGAFNKVKLKCKKCSKSFTVIAKDFLISPRNCKHCDKTYHPTYEDVVSEITQLGNKAYEVVSNTYVNTHTPLKILHKDCGTTYEVTRHNFRKGRRCPRCSQSVGENLVAMVLEDNEIKFTRNKKFRGLINVKPLSYDFYLEEHNVLIEYQGEQHYRPVKHFGGSEALKVQQRHDEIKRVYAKTHGIKLLEIPYVIKNKEEIEQLVLDIIK